METPSCKFYPQHGSSDAWKRAPPPPRASHKPWSSEHNLLLASTLSRDAIFDLLPLSLILQYLFGVFTFPFHFILGRVLRPSLGLCLHLYRHSAKLHRSSVSDSTSFHHCSSLHRSHSLFERLSLRLRQHVAWSAVPIPIGSIISD